MATAAAARKRRKSQVRPGEVRSVSALQGKQREYETVLILKPQVSKTEIREFVDRLQPTFNELNANVLKLDNWGMRLLAFPIHGHRKGVYLYWRYIGGSDIVSEFERLLRFNDKVIRYYSVMVDENVDPEARPSEVTEALLETISDPGPDPEEVARQQAEAEARARAEAEAKARAEAEAQAQQAAESGEEGGKTSEAEEGKA